MQEARRRPKAGREDGDGGARWGARMAMAGRGERECEVCCALSLSSWREQ